MKYSPSKKSKKKSSRKKKSINKFRFSMYSDQDQDQQSVVRSLTFDTKVGELPKDLQTKTLEYLPYHLSKTHTINLKLSRDITQEAFVELVRQMPYLQKLDCFSCKNITEIPFINTLRYLDISLCYNIRRFHLVNKLQTLKCRSLGMIRLDLPVSIINLDCSWCINLTELPYLPFLSFLNCSGCISVSNINSYPELRSLMCSGCSFNKIPLQPKLQDLFCSGCPNLTNIETQPNVSSICCNRCPNLTTIETQPNLDFINSNNCPLLNFDFNENRARYSIFYSGRR